MRPVSPSDQGGPAMRSGRRIMWMAAWVLGLLQGCGGAAGDAQAPPAAAAPPTLSGRVSNGFAPTDLGALQVTVKGQVGTARTAEGRLVAVDGADYLASLDQLSGPYLLSDSRRSPSTLSMYSLASGPGTANLTPLTTLLVAQLMGTDPGAYFEALGTRGGFTGVDDAAIAAAEQKLRRVLQRHHGFTVPATLGPVVTTPFSAVAGDPMFDTISALVTRLGVGGNIGALVAAVAQESGRCQLEQVAVTGASGSDDFCPFTRRNEVDPDHADQRVLAFGNQIGDTLTLRLRGTAVIDLALHTAEGATSRCTGTACSGVAIGPMAADQTRAITFTATPLSGTGGMRGTVTLTGQLTSAAAGVPLPGLPCTDNLFYLIDLAAARADGYCATPAGLGLNESGQSQPSGTTRRRYTFNDGLGGASLELVLQGTSVVSALVYATDANTGAATPQFLCRGVGCAGISLGERVVDQSLGVPVVLQPIRFEGAVLTGVQPDGTPKATQISVQARLTGFHVEDPNALPIVPMACSPGAPTVTAHTSEDASATAVCEPDDLQGFTLRSTTQDADGRLVLGTANLLSDGAGSYTSGNGISVKVTMAGQVQSASFDSFVGPQYRCTGAACAGIVVGPPDAQGERSVVFTAVTLTEVGSADLAGDRTARLDGRFIAPAGP